QVIGIFNMPDNGQPQLKNKVSIIADGIQDPGNLGTIIRCADWFGVEQVICSRDSADIYNPKTVQATMGSIARVKVFYEDLPSLLKKAEIPVFVAALHGKDVTAINSIKEGVIVIGNESKGVSEELL